MYQGRIQDLRKGGSYVYLKKERGFAFILPILSHFSLNIP